MWSLLWTSTYNLRLHATPATFSDLQLILSSSLYFLPSARYSRVHLSLITYSNSSSQTLHHFHSRIYGSNKTNIRSTMDISTLHWEYAWARASDTISDKPCHIHHSTLYDCILKTHYSILHRIGSWDTSILYEDVPGPPHPDLKSVSQHSKDGKISHRDHRWAITHHYQMTHTLSNSVHTQEMVNRRRRQQGLGSRM